MDSLGEVKVKRRSRLRGRGREAIDFSHVVIVAGVRGDGDGVEEAKKLWPRDPEHARRSADAGRIV